MSDVRKISLKKENLFAKQEPTIIGRLLPFLLGISFAFASLYNTARNLGTNMLAFFENSKGLVLIVDLALIGLIEFFVYVLILWVYKTILKTRPYFALVGERDFQETFGLCYVVRNMIVGAVGLLQFSFPFIAQYMTIFSMIMTYVAITCTYLFLSKKIDIMFRHLYYKLLFMPWFVWHAITAIFAIIFGGAIL